MQQSWESIPFYMFFIIRPDGNAAYSKIHEQYPLSIQTDQLLGVISLFSAVNNLQTGITHPDIVNNRKDEIDLAHKDSVKSLTTSTFQIRAFDNISGYRFVLMANHMIDSKKLDNKLEQIYKTFVNYVIKVPFFNVIFLICRKSKKLKVNNLRKKAIRFYIDDIYYMNNNESKRQRQKIYIYAEVDIDKAYSEVSSKSKKIKQFLETHHLTFQFIEEMRKYKNLRICFDNEIQKYIHKKQLNADLRVIKKSVFCGLEDFILERYEMYLEDEKLHQEYIDKIEEIENKFSERMGQLMKKIEQ